MSMFARGLVSFFGLVVCLLISVEGAKAQAGSWRAQESPIEDDLHNAVFLDGQTGWILAHESGNVLHTADGGETWTVRGKLRKGFLETIVFADVDRGWVGGEKGRLAFTVDGGATWKETGPGGAAVGFGSLYFPTSERGIALGSDLQALGSIAFVTDDGGRSWEASAPPVESLGFTDALSTLGPDRAIAGGFEAIHRTEDGGASWQSTAVETRAVRGLFFHDDTRGWAVGHDGFVAQTADAGRSWQTAPMFTRALLRDTLFVDADRGFMVGDLGKRAGVLYATEDGGQHWRREGGPYPGLHRLVRGGDRVWAVGKDGTILVRDIAPPIEDPPADLDGEPAAGADVEATEDGSGDAYRVASRPTDCRRAFVATTS